MVNLNAVSHQDPKARVETNRAHDNNEGKSSTFVTDLISKLLQGFIEFLQN